MIGCSIYGVVVIDGSLCSRFYGILLTGCSTPSYKLLHSLHVVEGGKVDEKSYEKWHDLCMIPL